MNTGLIPDIRACRANGYVVVSHGKLPLDPYRAYGITRSNKEAWHESGTPRRKFEGEYYIIDSKYSYKQLWDYYQTLHGINAFCGVKVCPFINPASDGDKRPTYDDMVHLAQTLDDYGGMPD